MYNTEGTNAPHSISIACDRNEPDDLSRMRLVRDGWAADYSTVETLIGSVVTLHLHPGAAKKVKV